MSDKESTDEKANHRNEGTDLQLTQSCDRMTRSTPTGVTRPKAD